MWCSRANRGLAAPNGARTCRLFVIPKSPLLAKRPEVGHPGSFASLSRHNLFRANSVAAEVRSLAVALPPLRMTSQNDDGGGRRDA
jgi:hypothetical protein